MSSWWTIEEFDREWRSVMKDFNVEQHPWVVEKDHTVGMWAQAYLTGHFFANVRSTQRCESMNSALNIILEHKKTYLEVVRAIDKGINDMRITELNQEYKNSSSKPFPMTKLHDLEGSAADIFTRASFEIVQEELKYETLYRALHPTLKIEGARTYRLIQYNDSEQMYEVVLDVTTNNITCTCRKFETLGLPCRHQLHVLKLEDFSEIPNCLILPRWTKNAKVSAPSYLHSDVRLELRQMTRFSLLRSLSSRLCYLASQTDESFKTTKDELLRLTAEFEQSITLNESSSHRVS
ncbi:hypothetical protein HRI_000448800 [Hibiscus trionum]|uniref:Protein FAR1-RELATED SEQUENCE n=1 Tax=Hibiscus trionum TaxID=183268 RepID=A0A9W7H1L1_HIBTR|nr:hypothetical protein HRI_000448800 [Hibiscus trionum]